MRKVELVTMSGRKRKDVKRALMSRTFKPVPSDEEYNKIVEFKPVSTKQQLDDTLERIFKVTNAGAAVSAHPLEVLGRTVRNMAHEAHADWLEVGERSKLAKKAYKEAYTKRKSENRREKRQKAIEEAQANAILKAETSVTERTLERAEKATNANKKAAYIGLDGVKKGIRATGEFIEDFEKNSCST